MKHGGLKAEPCHFISHIQFILTPLDKKTTEATQSQHTLCGNKKDPTKQTSSVTCQH